MPPEGREAGMLGIKDNEYYCVSARRAGMPVATLDMAFKAGDFHLANERFALAAHGLSPEVSNRFAYYLCAACAWRILNHTSISSGNNLSETQKQMRQYHVIV
jgi:hypothetical protein